jgi:hypothetical protein
MGHDILVDFYQLSEEYSLRLKVDIVCSSETPVDVDHSTRRLNPENSNLHSTAVIISSLKYTWGNMR